MLERRAISAGFVFVAITLATVSAQSPKRPISHRDYDSWRSISNPRLASDGRQLAYAWFPQDGDGEIVLRNLVTGQEWRFAAGARPVASTTSSESEPSEPPAAESSTRTISLAFTSDQKHLIFTTFPSKSAVAEARRAKKKPEQMPKGGLAIVKVAAGEEIRLANVRRFSIPKENGRWLAYLKEAVNPAEEEKSEAEAKQQVDDQRSARGASSRPADAPRYGSELVVRDLGNGAERTFADVASFEFSKDGEYLLYAVASRRAENNGVYAWHIPSNQLFSLATGKGKYEGITWDESQQQVAFYTDRDTADEKEPRFAVYLWKRGARQAENLITYQSLGMRPDWKISERGRLQFAKDGSRLFFSTAPTQDSQKAATAEAEDRVIADLWHWRDENVQSMQKVRAEQERRRDYRAAYLFSSSRVVQLCDPAMPELNLFEDSRFGLGTDDREYRPMVEFGERLQDTYLVDTATGARTLLFRKTRGNYIPSPDGRFLAAFNGDHWISYEIATGKTRNLTANLGVAFYNEDHDTPGARSAYGSAVWTKDSSAILVNDRYDVWLLAADGSRAKQITDGMGRRNQIEFRLLRFEDPDRPAGERLTVDRSQPLLLSAQNLSTRESGFWRERLDVETPPEKLLMAAKRFSSVTKAKAADLLLFTAERFDEFPDLYVSDNNFSDIRRVSHGNAQKEGLLWGSAELVNFRNADGLALQAALYKPENFDPSKKYPLIVYIYERLSQTVNQFRNPQPGTSINLPYYVSNGYLVLTPDIVYTVGAPGQSALKCVLPAIQAIADRGFVDENAIGIQGHSWGGYQISYMITQTTRFRAAVAGAPVANMISAYDGIRWGSGLPRQFQYEKTQSRIGGSIWQYPLRFIENSPIFFADRVRTPLMILHNDGDDAVPWSQGLEYFLALRRLGKEVYLFNYNGEPHGLRKRQNQKDWTVRMQQFFDHYLKGAPKPEWMERGIPYLEREREKETIQRQFTAGASGDKHF